LLIQGWLLEAGLGERIGVTDEEWEVIGPLPPPEHGRRCRPVQNNRPYFEGMMRIARTGAQWRHLPDEYGKWNSVFRRYRRWVTTGVFDAMLETLAELARRDTTADMIDSTVVRADHCAVGIKRGLRKPRRWADRAATLAPTAKPATPPPTAMAIIFRESSKSTLPVPLPSRSRRSARRS
jgi:transposase